MGDARTKATRSIASQAKMDFDRARVGFMRAYDAFPQDRLEWAPSETARSALEIAAHIALAVGHMLGNLKGDTFSLTTMSEADEYFRDAEKRLKSSREVLALFERNSKRYFDWLDSLTYEDLQRKVALPFDLGEVDMPAAISFMPMHIDWHAAQLHYLQTIYGDRKWI